MNPRVNNAILKSMGLQGGSAVMNPDIGAATADSANEFARISNAENTQAGLNLQRTGLEQRGDLARRAMAQQGEQFTQKLGLGNEMFDRRLAFDKTQFDRDIGLRRREMDYASDAGNTANILSAIGLGVEGLSRHKSAQRDKLFEAEFQKIIDKYDSMGDVRGAHFATLMKYYRN